MKKSELKNIIKEIIKESGWEMYSYDPSAPNKNYDKKKARANFQEFIDNLKKKGGSNWKEYFGVLKVDMAKNYIITTKNYIKAKGAFQDMIGSFGPTEIPGTMGKYGLGKYNNGFYSHSERKYKDNPYDLVTVFYDTTLNRSGFWSGMKIWKDNTKKPGHGPFLDKLFED